MNPKFIDMLVENFVISKGKGNHVQVLTNTGFKKAWPHLPKDGIIFSSRDEAIKTLKNTETSEPAKVEPVDHFLDED